MTTPEGLDESPAARSEASDGVTDGSAVLGAVRSVSDRVTTAVRGSLLYDWLTKEPEPEVIVIDLRETWTVGPFIAVLDRVVDWVAPYWRDSTPKRALDELVALGECAADTRAGQLLATVLAPPELSDADDADSGRTPAPSSTDVTGQQGDASAPPDTTGSVGSNPTETSASDDATDTRES